MATGADQNNQWLVYFGTALILLLCAGVASLTPRAEPESVRGQFETTEFRAVVDNLSLPAADSDRYALDFKEVTALDADLRTFLHTHLATEPACAQKITPILRDYVRFYHTTLRKGVPVVEVLFAHNQLFQDMGGKLLPLDNPTISDGGTEQFALTYALTEQRMTEFMFSGLRCQELNF